MINHGSTGGTARPEPPDRTSVSAKIALALLAIPLVPIMCLSSLQIFIGMAPSEPCVPPFVQDQSECGPEPLAVFPTALLAAGYATVAAITALRSSLPTWIRIVALAVAPLATVPLLWALFVYRPY
jgi:hypothetical protein